MIRRRRAGPAPESMLDRYRQVYRAGEVTLHPFTPAELDAVTLDAEAFPAAERGPFVQAATPLLTGQERRLTARPKPWARRWRGPARRWRNPRPPREPRRRPAWSATASCVPARPLPQPGGPRTNWPAGRPARTATGPTAGK